MGKVATKTTARTRTSPNTGPNWPRTIRRLVAAGILSVAAAALAHERDKWLPPLLDHGLPDAYARVRGQPLAIQIGAAVFVLDMLLAAAIFVIRDYILRTREAAQTAQAEDARQQENTRLGAAQAFAPAAAELKAQGSEIVAKVDAVQRTTDKGVEQGGETLALVREIDRKLTAEAPPIPATVAAPGGLPRPATLLGRDDTLAALMRDLRDHDAPIGVFALHGMGGIGKTALAAEAVARLSADRAAFPGGAAWISCESLHGADGLAELWSRVARALGLHEIAALPDAATRRAALASALATRPRTLLALDNVEPDLDAYAALDPLAAAGRIALLLTARQAVAPDRLRAVALPPLPDPDAVTLFRQRLTQADPTRPTAADLPHIPALAAAVGALPLALEQLAAYAGAQKRPLAALAADLARDGINAAAFRANPHRTLAATFDRSWDVLLPRQRRLFAGLSLLAGASLPR
ncbi:MAG TPA: NB-ARC domain-containing protein, partial [Ktedonobacterales bacterium]|nr:NB-ARC domain-containing protein [Ktedonobacterales bacterium]